MMNHRERNAVAVAVAARLGVSALTACGPTTSSVGNPPEVAAPTKVTAVKVVGGEAHTCAILSDQALKCWGANASGQLGQGDTAARGTAPGQLGAALKPISLGAGRTAIDVAAGGAHTCAILDDRSVKCWGRGQVGQLGLGNGSNQGDAAGEMGDALPKVDLGAGLTAISISAGKQHTCAVLNTGAAKCWGYNARGELGQGNTATIGNRAGEMGDNLKPIRLGTGKAATSISSGWYFNCALLADLAVKCWGFNNYGQLGLGDTTNRGTSPGQMGDALPAVDLGTNAKGSPAGALAVSSGGGHVCAVIDQPGDRKGDNDTAKCWGDNEQGQLGQGDTKNRGDQPGELGNTLPTISLGTQSEAEAVGAGAYQTCALVGLNGKKREAVKCWGGNDKGQLGLGDTANRGGAPDQMGDKLPAVSLDKIKDILGIGLGGWQSCAILDGTKGLKCWGGNDSGQLGLGDTRNRGDQPGEMGSALPAVDLG